MIKNSDHLIREDEYCPPHIKLNQGQRGFFPDFRQLETTWYIIIGADLTKIVMESGSYNWQFELLDLDNIWKSTPRR